MSHCAVCGQNLDRSNHQNDFRLELRVVAKPSAGSGVFDLIESGLPDGLDVDLCGVKCLREFAQQYRYHEKRG
jgi:hypothetical protein